MGREEHIFKRFDQELADLNGIVLRMGGLVEDQIAKAMKALRDADVEAARQVNGGENERCGACEVRGHRKLTHATATASTITCARGA